MSARSRANSVLMSEASSVMIRAASGEGESERGSFKITSAREIDNTRLSALTNKIMELVLDNIKMLHLN